MEPAAPVLSQSRESGGLAPELERHWRLVHARRAIRASDSLQRDVSQNLERPQGFAHLSGLRPSNDEDTALESLTTTLPGERNSSNTVSLGGSAGKEQTKRVALAISGGGIRSACFGGGVMRSLLTEGYSIRTLSGVSGGAFVGGSYLAWLGANLKRAKESITKRSNKNKFSMLYLDLNSFFTHQRRNIGYLGKIQALGGLGILSIPLLLILLLFLVLLFWMTTVLPWSIVIAEVTSHSLSVLAAGCDVVGSGNATINVTNYSTVISAILWYDKYFLSGLAPLALSPLSRLTIVMVVLLVVWLLCETAVSIFGRKRSCALPKKWHWRAAFTSMTVLRTFCTFVVLSLLTMVLGNLAEPSPGAAVAMDSTVVLVIVVSNFVRLNPMWFVSRSNLVDLGMYFTFVCTTGYLMRFASAGALQTELSCMGESCLRTCSFCVEAASRASMCENSSITLVFHQVHYSLAGWRTCVTLALVCIAVYPLTERAKLRAFHSFYEWRLRKSFMEFDGNSLVEKKSSELSEKERFQLMSIVDSPQPTESLLSPSARKLSKTRAHLDAELSFFASVAVNLWAKGGHSVETDSTVHNVGIEFRLTDVVRNELSAEKVSMSDPRPVTADSVYLSKSMRLSNIRSQSGSSEVKAAIEDDTTERIKEERRKVNVPPLSSAVALSGAALSIYNGTLALGKSSSYRQAQASVGLGLGQWVDITRGRLSLKEKIASLSAIEWTEIGFFGISGAVALICFMLRESLKSVIPQMMASEMATAGVNTVLILLAVMPFIIIVILSICLRERVPLSKSRSRKLALLLDKLVFMRQMRLFFGLVSYEDDIPDVAYLSDGGHVENMGLSALVGRWTANCKEQLRKEMSGQEGNDIDMIVVADASEDSSLKCSAFLKSVAYVQREYGVQLEGLQERILENGLRRYEACAIERVLDDAFSKNNSAVLARIVFNAEGNRFCLPLIYTKPVRDSRHFQQSYRDVREFLQSEADGELVDKLELCRKELFKSSLRTFMILEGRSEGGLDRLRHAVRFGYLCSIPKWDPEPGKWKRRLLHLARNITSCGAFPHESAINQYFFPTKYDAYHLRGIASMDEGLCLLRDALNFHVCFCQFQEDIPDVLGSESATKKKKVLLL